MATAEYNQTLAKVQADSQLMQGLPPEQRRAPFVALAGPWDGRYLIGAAGTLAGARNIGRGHDGLRIMRRTACGWSLVKPKAKY